MTRFFSKFTFTFSLIILFHICGQLTFAQISRFDRDRAKRMLNTIAKQIKKSYYDPNLHGIDLDARVKSAKERIEKASSLGQAFGIIAQVLLDFNDSHTNFLPPRRAAKFEYGWRVMMIGDNCYVYAVKPKSDAHKKGLKAGDMVLSVNGFRPNRKELWKMNYYYYALSPQAQTKLIVQSPGEEKPKEIIAKTKITKLTRILNLNDSFGVNEILREINDHDESRDSRFVKTNDITVWKMPTFSIDPADIGGMVGKYLKNQSALILDLRGNGGGFEVTLKKLAGFMFSNDVKIADIKRRKETKEVIAKTAGSDSFGGKLIVLVDSRSGSASEMFARVIQLEKRGIILGDTSAGAVMRSRFHRFTMGASTQIAYGATITDADGIMTDGKSLEHTGVTPNETVLPSGGDLANGRDPVMTRALELLGVKISSDVTGKWFPTFWADGKKGNVTKKIAKP